MTESKYNTYIWHQLELFCRIWKKEKISCSYCKQEKYGNWTVTFTFSICICVSEPEQYVHIHVVRKAEEGYVLGIGGSSNMFLKVENQF